MNTNTLSVGPPITSSPTHAVGSAALVIVGQVFHCVAAAVTTISLTAGSTLDFGDALRWLGLVSLGGLGWGLFGVIGLTRELFNVFGLFLVASYLFHCGQLWVELVGFESRYSFLVAEAGIETATFVTAAAYSVLSLSLLQLAGFCSLEWASSKREGHGRGASAPPRNFAAGRPFALGFLVLTLALRLYFDSQRLGGVFSAGYAEFYKIELTGAVSPLLVLEASVAVAFAANVLAFRDNRFFSNLFFGAGVAFFLVSMILIGNRGEQVTAIVLLAWVRHRFVSKWVLRNYAVATAAGIALLMLLAFIAHTRSQSRAGLLSGGYFQEVEGRNLLVDSVSEFGGTLLTPVLAFRHVPSDVPFANGMSYISAWVIQIPKLGAALEWPTRYAVPSAVLNKFGFPIGGSYIGEAYFNFGWYGLFVMLAVGGAIGWLTAYTLSQKCGWTFISTIVLFAFVHAVFLFPRDQMYVLAMAGHKSVLIYLVWRLFAVTSVRP